MVASARGAHFKGVTIGQVPVIGPTFLDNFTGAAQLLSLHTPDIGNSWTYFDTGGSPTASTTGAGSVISDDNVGQEASYKTTLTHTGTSMEAKFYVDENLDSVPLSVALAVRKPGPGFPGIIDIFSMRIAAVISYPGEPPMSSGLIFEVFVNDVQVWSYIESNTGFITGAEYKLVISGTSVSCFIGGVLLDTGTISAITTGPTEIQFGVGKNVSVSSVSLNIDSPTPV